MFRSMCQAFSFDNQSATEKLSNHRDSVPGKQKQEFRPDNRCNRSYSKKRGLEELQLYPFLTTSRLPLALTRWHVLRLPDMQSLIETFSSFSTAFHVRCDAEVKEELQGTFRSAYKRWATYVISNFFVNIVGHTQLTIQSPTVLRTVSYTSVKQVSIVIG